MIDIETVSYEIFEFISTDKEGILVKLWQQAFLEYGFPLYERLKEHHIEIKVSNSKNTLTLKLGSKKITIKRKLVYRAFNFEIRATSIEDYEKITTLLMLIS